MIADGFIISNGFKGFYSVVFSLVLIAAMEMIERDNTCDVFNLFYIAVNSKFYLNRSF